MLQGAVALYCFVLISLFYHEKREISNLIIFDSSIYFLLPENGKAPFYQTYFTVLILVKTII